MSIAALSAQGRLKKNDSDSQSLFVRCSVPCAKSDEGFDFESETVRGVDIGGWLVLEPWITLLIIESFNGSVVDEYGLTEKLPNVKR